MLKAFSRLLVVSCFVAAVISQGTPAPDDGVGSGDRQTGNGFSVTDNTCLFWGDPHIWTFDSAVFSYQDPGWHHIIVSPTLNIQSKFIPGCYNGDLTNACAQDLRIFVLDENNNVNTVEVYLNASAQAGFNQVLSGSVYYQILINGQDSGLYSVVDPDTGKPTYPYVQPNTELQIGTATQALAYYVISQGIFQLKFVINGDIVISHIPQVLTITPLGSQQQNSLWNNICGLCGNFNGWAGDDFTLHDTSSQYLQINNQNLLPFANTWAIDYVDSSVSARPVLSSPAGNAFVNQTGVFQCNWQPNPTPPPTNAPTPTPAVPTRAPPTAAPTPASTPAPTPSNGPAPTGTPAPTNPPTAAPTAAPTFPPSQAPTPQPTNPPAPTPSPTPRPIPPHNNTNYTSADNTTAITNAQGSQIYTDAQTSCQNAGLAPNSPVWDACMYDVTQTNTTSSAVASAGALVLAGCAKTNLTDTSCVANTLFACPGACNANGACVQGQCVCSKGWEGTSCATKAPLLTAAQLAGVISAGAVAGIAIGAAVFAGLAGFGAKKGYDYYHMKDNKMSNVNSNPLYAEKNTGGVSPLYAEKA